MHDTLLWKRPYLIKYNLHGQFFVVILLCPGGKFYVYVLTHYGLPWGKHFIKVLAIHGTLTSSSYRRSGRIYTLYYLQPLFALLIYRFPFYYLLILRNFKTLWETLGEGPPPRQNK